MSKVNGQVEAEDILAAVRPATCLVTIMLANNETGVIMVSRCPPGETRRGRGLLARTPLFLHSLVWELPPHSRSQLLVSLTLSQWNQSDRPLSALPSPARARDQPASPSPEPTAGGRGAAGGACAHGCCPGPGEAARGRAGPGRGLPDHRGAQGSSARPPALL